MENSIKAILIIIALGVWVLVLQNTGILPMAQKVQIVEKSKDKDSEENKEEIAIPVRVVNTPDVDARVYGTVSVDNTVDVNLHEINGYRNCFYNSYNRHPNDYYRIPIADY